MLWRQQLSQDSALTKDRERIAARDHYITPNSFECWSTLGPRNASQQRCCMARDRARFFFSFATRFAPHVATYALLMTAILTDCAKFWLHLRWVQYVLDFWIACILQVNISSTIRRALDAELLPFRHALDRPRTARGTIDIEGGLCVFEASLGHCACQSWFFFFVRRSTAQEHSSWRPVPTQLNGHYRICTWVFFFFFNFILT